MLVSNIDVFADYWRRYSPRLYDKKSDEEIYSLIQKRYPKWELAPLEQSLAADEKRRFQCISH